MKRLLLINVMLLTASVAALAAVPPVRVVSGDVILLWDKIMLEIKVPQEVLEQPVAATPARPKEKIKKEKKEKLPPIPGFSHFTWGADVGSSVDMTGNDMSSIDINAYFGYKSRFVRFAGIGAGINMMIGNGSSAYPVYAMFRSGFSNRPTLCFLDLRAGCSFNNIFDFRSQTDFYGSLGFGITLAKGRNFSSHIILSYNFMPLSDATVNGQVFKLDDLHYAALRIGAAF